MSVRNICRTLTFVALTLASANIALGQSGDSTEVIGVSGHHTWQDAEMDRYAGGRLFVVTIDQPERRQSCHVQIFTAEEIVCSRAVGSPRTYLSQQILALIVPRDLVTKIALMVGFNGGMGAAIWGSVVLAAACPLCAAGTALAALWFFGEAGAELFGDDQPERLIYLAPGQQLSRKFGYVQN
ncbi:MAG: hypothetical protein WA414_20180 [Acidobacteriaceae bacterium]